MKNPNVPEQYKLGIKTTNYNVDSKNRVIKNVILCQAGEAKGHGEWLEQEFIDDLVKFSNDNFSEGLPSNYGHNWDNLGKQLGVIKDIRVDGDKAVGDLHLFESADLSPDVPGVASYVMALAAEDRKALNMSIVFNRKGYYQRNDKGEKITVDWASIDENNKLYVEFGKLISSDIVDDGAATETLYSKKKPNQNDGLIDRFFSMFKKESGEKIIALEAERNQLIGQLAHVTKTNNTLQAQITQLKADHNTEITALNKKIKDLEEEPGSTHSGGDTEEADDTPESNYRNSAINKRAQEIAKTVKK